MKTTKTTVKLSGFLRGLFPAAALLALLAVPSQAAIILSLSPSSPTAAPGSTGNYFDVLLTTDTSTSYDISAFSFGLDATTADLTFTGVQTTVPSYVFAGNSLFAPDIRTTPDGQSVLASDLTNSGLDVTLAGNSTYGLGRVFYSVGQSANGVVGITFYEPATSLSDAKAASVAIQTMSGGSVTIGSVATPEPGTMSLFLLGLPALALLRKRK